MNTGAVLFSNNASARLKIATDAASPTISVEDGFGAKFPQPLGDGSNWFMVTVEDRRTNQIEIMKCTARAVDILTVTRAQEGTVAQDFLQYASVVNRMTAGMMATFFEFNGYSIPEADDRFINAAGDEMFGPLLLPPGPPTDPEHATNKQYVDDVSIDEAPTDGRAYARSMVNWTPIGTGLAEAPNDGLLYGRGSLDWHETVTKPAFDAEVASTDAEITALDGRVDTLEVTVGTHTGEIADLQTTNTSQNSSIAALQAADVTHTSDIAALDGRMDAVEADGVSQDDRLDLIEAKDVTQDGRLTAVENKNTAQDATIATKIGDAPNDANAYVRSALAWVVGYTKAAIDTLLAGKVAKAGDTMTGNLTIGPAAATPVFALNKPAGAFSNNYQGYAAGSVRWNMALGTNVAESGGNAGSDFLLTRYSDAGASLGNPIAVNRATGIVTLGQLAVTTGPITVAGLPMVGGASMSDTPPVSPVNGQLWWQSSTGNTFVFYVDPGGGAGQWVQQNVSNPAAAGQVGEIAYFARDTAPIGFLECNGASFTTASQPLLFAAIGYTFGGSGLNFNVPDLRGEFIRGWSNGRAGVDAARAFGSAQVELVGPHTQPVQCVTATSGGTGQGVMRAQGAGVGQGDIAGWVKDPGGIENRPRNVALLPCIRYLPTVEGVAPDALPMPVFKGARVKLNANKTLTTGVVTAVIWDAEMEDVGDWWVPGSPTLFTVPAGVTRVRALACGCFDSNAAGFRQVAIYKNGAAMAPSANSIFANTGSAAQITTDSGWLPVVPGDTFSANLYHNAGANLLILATACWFAIEAYPGQ